MKKLLCLLFIITIISACKLRPDEGIINNAAIHFSGIFITENIPSIPTLRIGGRPVAKKIDENTYTVTGSVEGFSPMNYPVSIQHFSETLRYLGGNPDDRQSWECIDIYIGNKKMK